MRYPPPSLEETYTSARGGTSRHTIALQHSLWSCTLLSSTPPLVRVTAPDAARTALVDGSSVVHVVYALSSSSLSVVPLQFTHVLTFNNSLCRVGCALRLLEATEQGNQHAPDAELLRWGCNHPAI